MISKKTFVVSVISISAACITACADLSKDSQTHRAESEGSEVALRAKPDVQSNDSISDSSDQEDLSYERSFCEDYDANLFCEEKDLTKQSCRIVVDGIEMIEQGNGFCETFLALQKRICESELAESARAVDLACSAAERLPAGTSVERPNR